MLADGFGMHASTHLLRYACEHCGPRAAPNGGVIKARGELPCSCLRAGQDGALPCGARCPQPSRSAQEYAAGPCCHGVDGHATVA